MAPEIDGQASLSPWVPVPPRVWNTPFFQGWILLQLPPLPLIWDGSGSGAGSPLRGPWYLRLPHECMCACLVSRPTAQYGSAHSFLTVPWDFVVPLETLHCSIGLHLQNTTSNIKIIKNFKAVIAEY